MIHSYKFCIEKVGEIGIVEEVNGMLMHVKGLPGASVDEGVSFENGDHGVITALNPEYVEVLSLSGTTAAPESKLARTGRALTITVGDGLLGHTVSALGLIISQKKIKSDLTETRMIETKPIGIVGRKKINNFLATGTCVVDLMVPIGMGQRELVIGDRKTGKTHFLLQTAVNQARAGTVCVYALIGKTKTEIKSIQDYFREQKVSQNCVLVASGSYDGPGEIYVTPFTAMTIAEFFRDRGQNVLIILDDLTTHAKYYREISLVGGRFPGRQSYPGDVFNVHSRLVERAGNFDINGKAVSITCLPVSEMSEGDMTGYIETNLMSMTDGHIYFDHDLYTKGKRPAVNVFLSVTRVGKQTQNKLTKEVSHEVMNALKRYEDMQKFLRFGSELTDNIRRCIFIGDKILRFFSQVEAQLFDQPVQVILVGLIWVEIWDGVGGERLAWAYKEDMNVKVMIDDIFSQSANFADLQENVKRESKFFLHYLKGEKIEEEPDLKRTDPVSQMTESVLPKSEPQADKDSPSQPPKEYPGKMTPISQEALPQ